MKNTVLRSLAALTLALSLGLAHAQDAQYDDSPQSDPPDRAARLSYLQGEVSMQPAGEDDWAPAILNRPLTTGDKLWTEQGSRAEIYVGPAAVRLDSDTGFSFLNVDDDTIQMRMTAGVINVRVRDLDDNDHIEIDTPNIALSLLRPGNYRVEVNDAGDTTVVKISSGEAEATGPSQTVIVHAQQVARFTGTDRVATNFSGLGAPDEFDSWSFDRDGRDDRVAQSRTAEYVSPDVTGYQDLDDNGSWSNEAEYGYVWTPTRVAVDWAPYRYGRWVWVSPWGWSWIDDSPWGYAPFHYGRWTQVRNRWCWVPGPRHVRAVYAPALVGWIGGPRTGVSVGVGWFPLGPREVYVPVRRFSPGYMERVNMRNTTIVSRTIIRDVYDNRARDVNYRWRGSSTVVTRQTFTTATRVGNNRVRVSETEIQRTTVVNAGPRISPVRESRMGETVRANVRVPPKNVVDRQVVVRRPPPASGAHFARNEGRVEAPRGNVDRGNAERSPRQDGRADVRTEQRDQAGGAAPIVRSRPERNDRPGSAEPRSSVTNQNPTAYRRDENRAPLQTAPAAAPADRTNEDRSREDRPRGDRPPRQYEERRQHEQPNREVQTQPAQYEPRPASQPRERPQAEPRPQSEPRSQGEPRQYEPRQRQQAEPRQQSEPRVQSVPREQSAPRDRPQQQQQQQPRPERSNRSESKPEPKSSRSDNRRDNQTQKD